MDEGRRRAPAAAAWLLSTPAVVLIALLAIVPAINLLVDAFLSAKTGSPTVDNFAALLDSKLAMQAFWRTLRVATATTLLTIVAGYPLALVLQKARPAMAAFVLVLVVFPLMTSVVVRVYGWLVILGPSGIVNKTLMGLGLIGDPLALIHNEIGIIIGETQLLLPYMVLSLVAVLQKVDPYLEEAALSLGANPVVTFLRVVLPISLPGLMTGVLLVFSLAMTAFATPLLIGGPRVPLMTTLLYTYVFTSFDWAGAAAVAVVLVILALAFVTAQRLIAEAGLKRHG